MQSSTLKILEIFEMSILNLKKSQTLRLKLRIPWSWGFKIITLDVDIVKMDASAWWKISKRHFFKDIENSF